MFLLFNCDSTGCSISGFSISYPITFKTILIKSIQYNKYYYISYEFLYFFLCMPFYLPDHIPIFPQSSSNFKKKLQEYVGYYLPRDYRYFSG